MACYLLIAANVLIFFIVHLFIQSQDFLMTLIATPENLKTNNWMCLLTSGFIHVDLIHLGLNMLGLFVFGRIVEEHLGTGALIFIYFGALIISMLFAIISNSLIFHKQAGIIGASGAVMGLLAAAMLLDPFRITYEMLFPLPIMFKGWLFIFADLKGFLNPKPDGISHAAHVFGFFSVFCLVYFMSKADRKKLNEGLAVNIFTLLFFLSAIFVVSMLKG